MQERNDHMHKKRRFLSVVGDRLSADGQLPGFESYSFRMNAEGELYFTGKCELRTYTDREISLVFDRRSVTVKGNSLSVLSLRENAVEITGTAEQIMIEEHGKAGE